MADTWKEAGLPDLELSHEEVAATKAQIKQMGSDGYVQMMAVMNHPMAVARARLYPQTRKLQLARTIIGIFNIFFLLIVPITLYLTTRWYWALAALAFYYFILNGGVQSSINLELGVRMLLLDEKLREWGASKERDQH
ncbi:MAG: hypothetical protein AB1631_13730 [Acidobacteriota bacterium]